MEHSNHEGADYPLMVLRKIIHTMKKILFATLSVLLVLTACQPKNGASKMEITPTVLDLKVGDQKMVTLIGNTSRVTWSSLDESVATVYEGMVEAVGVGRTTIMARDGEAQASCEVIVVGSDGSTLRLGPAVSSLEKGETVQLKCGNSYGLELKWSSSDENVVKVDNNGLCTAVAPGNAFITVATSLEEEKVLVAVKHHWGEYKLVWSDEFDGDKLDESVWNYERGGRGWGNKELQNYTDRPENIRVKDGYLEIEARKEKYEENEYTSARIQSRGKKYFKYGRVESRISFPGGQGTWPAFWMMGNQGGWPACGEIDIIEHVGSLPDRCSFAVHTPMKNGTKGNNWSKLAWLENIVGNFHVYGVEWAQEEENGKDVIRFTVDGKEHATIWEDRVDDPDYWPFNKEHYIIYNMAVGGMMGGTVGEDTFDEKRIMYVDWVRVYQREEQK